MKHIRLVIAEDMEIVRKGLKALVTSQPGFTVIGEAGDGHAAVQITQQTKPDVVLMDLALPRLDGMEAIAEIKRLCPGVRVLALTAHGKEHFISAAMNAGVDGYILKVSPSEELFAAITAVASGKDFFSRKISTIVEQVGRNGGDKTGATIEQLSKRERQVLKLAAKGLSNKDVADSLFVSVKTVEKHKTNLKKKLGLRSALELAAFCVENGLTEVEEV